MPISENDIIVKQAEAEKACITGFDANCPENVSRGILWPKRGGIIQSWSNLLNKSANCSVQTVFLSGYHARYESCDTL